MSLLDDLRNKLKPELFTQVTDALGDDFNFDVVPRTRLNKVIKQRDSFKEQLEEANGGTQHRDPDDDDDSDDTKGKQKLSGNSQNKQTSGKQPTVEELRQQMEAEKASAIMDLKIQFAGLSALRDAGAVDADLAYSLIDKSKVKIGDDGKISGLDDQITALKTGKTFLFSPAGGREGAAGGTGKNGGDDKFAAVKGKKEFLALSTDDQIAFKAKYPDVFKTFLNS